MSHVMECIICGVRIPSAARLYTRTFTKINWMGQRFEKHTDRVGYFGKQGEMVWVCGKPACADAFDVVQKLAPAEDTMVSRTFRCIDCDWTWSQSNRASELPDVITCNECGQNCLPTSTTSALRASQRK